MRVEEEDAAGGLRLLGETERLRAKKLVANSEGSGPRGRTIVLVDARHCSKKESAVNSRILLAASSSISFAATTQTA